MYHKYPYTDFHELNLDDWIRKLKTALQDIDNLKEAVKVPDQKFKAIQEELDALSDKVNGLINGDYINVFIPPLLEALDEALPEMIGRMMQLFIFGLTKDGYFTAMYPDSLDNIMFDTIADPESDLYGHLVLQF